MAIRMSPTDRAEVIREMALELLAKANELDGKVPCTCAHLRDAHQTGLGPWTGFCGDPDCECEGYEAW